MQRDYDSLYRMACSPFVSCQDMQKCAGFLSASIDLTALTRIDTVLGDTYALDNNTSPRASKRKRTQLDGLGQELLQMLTKVNFFEYCSWSIDNSITSILRVRDI